MLLTAQSVPGVFSGTAYNANLVEIEASFLDLGTYVISGLALSAGAGLTAAVATGVASIGGRVTVGTGFNVTGLANGATNDIYLLNTGGGVSLSHPSTPPANSVLLGQAVTAGGVVTSVNMGRSSGRQQFLQPQALIPGGPAAGLTSAGHLASINLANWAAAAAEGIAVFGVAPAGSLPVDVAYIDQAQVWTQQPTFPGLTSTGHLLSTGTIPTVSAQAGAGTSPPAPVIVTGSTDTRGWVTFGSGTTPPGGAMVRVTYANAYALSPYVFLQNMDDTITTEGLSVSNHTAAHFDINFHNAPAASQPNTKWSVQYLVVG